MDNIFDINKRVYFLLDGFGFQQDLGGWSNLVFSFYLGEYDQCVTVTNSLARGIEDRKLLKCNIE